MSTNPHTKRAGRPVGTGRYGEQTKVMRVPSRLADKIQDLLLRDALDNDADMPVTPLYSSRVQAGMPVGVEDHVEARVNLHSHLVHHPDATFFVRAQGRSMIGAGIQDGDLLVVDRSVPAMQGSIVVASLDGELTVKTLDRRGKGVRLLPENPDYPVIEVGEEQSLVIMGVVTSVVHEFSGH